MLAVKPTHPSATRPTLKMQSFRSAQSASLKTYCHRSTHLPFQTPRKPYLLQPASTHFFCGTRSQIRPAHPTPKEINFQEANRGGGGAVAQLQASPQETVCCTAENPALSSKLDRSKSNNTYTRGMRRFAPQATSFSYIKPRCFKCNTSVPHNPRDLTKAGIRFVMCHLMHTAHCIAALRFS